jgi:hypothetical protein
MPTALSKFVLGIDVIFSYLYASPLLSHNPMQANRIEAGSRPSSSPRKTTTSRIATSTRPRSSTAARKSFHLPGIVCSSPLRCPVLNFAGSKTNAWNQLLHLRRDVPRDRLPFCIPSRECARAREECPRRCACHYYYGGLGACVVIANRFLRLV